MTNRLTLLSLGFLTLSFINQTIYGSEVDFFIGETVNSTPLKSKLIFKEEALLPDIQRVKLISNFFDEIDKEEIDKASIPDISPHSFAQIKFKSEKSDNLTLAEFSELRNQSIEERKKNTKWNHITFEVDNQMGEKEDISVYWGSTQDWVLFLMGESEHYVFAPFQRTAPWKNKKTGIVYQKYEIGLLEK